MLDIIQYINDNTPNLTVSQKAAMLTDFCLACGWVSGNKKDFANQKLNELIKETIKNSVNNHRQRKAESEVIWENLNLD